MDASVNFPYLFQEFFSKKVLINAEGFGNDSYKRHLRENILWVSLLFSVAISGFGIKIGCQSHELPVNALLPSLIEVVIIHFKIFIYLYNIIF